MITFRCAKCAVLVQAPLKKIGKPVTCKKCQHVEICPPASILVPLRPERKKRQVGSPEFMATIGAIGLAGLVWVIWTVAAS
jgi:hypothetical protein